MKGILYKNIFLYRLMMQALYAGKYRGRFDKIFSLAGNAGSINELCFGDIYFAGLCKTNNIRWTGFDSSSVFVKHALKKGFEARHADLNAECSIPEAELSVIAGSLYFFASDPDRILEKMLASSSKVILSEPVVNISKGKVLRKLTQYLENSPSRFRYTEESLLGMLDQAAHRLNFKYRIAARFHKDIIVLLENNTGLPFKKLAIRTAIQAER